MSRTASSGIISVRPDGGWVDIEDVAAVAAASLLDPEKHNGQIYRLGYQAATYDQIAAIFTEVIGQPFSYEARPPEEFYRKVLAAGAEPAYMKCVFDLFTEINQWDRRETGRSL
jgi:NAD(P)H dehydrogenase (quinone)